MSLKISKEAMSVFGRFEVHAGDFEKGKEHQFQIDKFCFARIEVSFWSGMKVTFSEEIKSSEVQAIEIATEESVKRLGGTVGWGLAGGVLLGPVGLLAGLLAGGRGKNVTFVCTFKDGRKFMGTTDSKTYTKMAASVF